MVLIGHLEADAGASLQHAPLQHMESHIYSLHAGVNGMQDKVMYECVANMP